MMADWTVCRNCQLAFFEAYHEGPVYLDALGIAWSEDELKEAGGKEEVDRMVRDARNPK